jgi:hypothetical protein
MSKQAIHQDSNPLHIKFMPVRGYPCIFVGPYIMGVWGSDESFTTGVESATINVTFSCKRLVGSGCRGARRTRKSERTTAKSPGWGPLPQRVGSLCDIRPLETVIPGQESLFTQRQILAFDDQAAKLATRVV